MASKDPERAKEYNRAYREANREKARAATRQWRLDNPDRAREADRRKREKKPELYRAMYKRHYDANAEKICAGARDWRDRNPEKVKSYRKPRTTEQNREVARRWREKNPESAREHVRRYRARKRGALVTEKIDRLAIYERDNGRCHLCGQFVARNSFTLDHLKPLALGGDHTAANVKIAHARCNSRKGARFISQ